MVLGDSQLPANPWLFSVALRGITETETNAPKVGFFEVLEGSPGPVERDRVLQHPWPAFETEGQEAGELQESCRGTEEQAEPLEEPLEALPPGQARGFYIWFGEEREQGFWVLDMLLGQSWCVSLQGKVDRRRGCRGSICCIS